MAEGRTFQAKIEVMGRIHASLSGAVRQAQNQLNKLAAATRKIGAAIGAGFAKIGAVIKSFAGQLVGVTLAFAGMSSAAGFIRKATEQFRENEKAAKALNAVLENNPKILRLGQRELANQQKRFHGLADSMQEASVYASSVWREAFVGLAQWGAGAADAERLSGAINDILSARYGLKATGSDAKALGNQLGQAVAKGNLGKLKKEFGFSKDDEVAFGKLRTAAERIDWLNRRVSERGGKYAGRAAALGREQAAEIQKAQNRINDFQNRVGEGFTRIEAKWVKFVDRIVPKLEPAILKATEIAEKYFDQFTNWIEKDAIPAWEDFASNMAKPELKEAFETLQTAAEEVYKPIAKIVEAIKEAVGLTPGKTFGEWFSSKITFAAKELADNMRDLQKIIETIKGYWDALFGGKTPENLPPEVERAGKFAGYRGPPAGWSAAGSGAGAAAAEAAVASGASAEEAATAGRLAEAEQAMKRLPRAPRTAGEREAMEKRAEAEKAAGGATAAAPTSGAPGDLSAAAKGILKSEGYHPNFAQGGIKELFGFRAHERTGYAEILAAAKRGGEPAARAEAEKFLMQRGKRAGAEKFSDVGAQAAMMSMAHMRGEGGAQAIMNTVGTGAKIQKSGRLDPKAVEAINKMSADELHARVREVRTAYDDAIYGHTHTRTSTGKSGRWRDVYGLHDPKGGLYKRYVREQKQYAALSKGQEVAAAAAEDLEEMQEGGIVREPTRALIGEGGPEAVLPLGGGPVGAGFNLGKAMQALAGGHRAVNYTPQITINGGGPSIVSDVERVVRSGVDELMRQIEALDSEMMRRAFR